MAGIEQDSHLPRAFKLERFLAEHEFTTKYLLCCSDCEPLPLSDVLRLADADSKRRWESLSLAYTDPEGSHILREEITSLYTSVTSKDIIVAAPQELISIATLAMLTPGDHIVATYPGYQSLYEIARTMGCEVSFWECSENPQGSLDFQVSQLKGLMRPNTRAVVVNFPHNPTGALLSHADWQTVVDVCREANAFLFSDEMYRLLESNPKDRLPAAVDFYERGVSLSGMSKAFGMPGIRIGWLATRDKGLLQNVLRLHDYTTICNSAPSEVLAIIGLRAKEQLVRNNVATIAANLALARDFFAKHIATFEFQEPAAGSVAFARLTTGEPIQQFCQRLVNTAGVLLLPADVYEHDASVARGYFRLGLGRRNFGVCLEALDAWLVSEKAGGH